MKRIFLSISALSSRLPWDMKPLSYLLTLLIVLSNPAYAAYDNDNGVVSMHGSILDTACAIATEDREQTIDMGTAVTGSLIREGIGPSRQLTIHLVNCTLKHYNLSRPDWSVFQVTFDGATDENGLFTVIGTAKGIGLEITDSVGNIAIAGKAMPDGALQTGDMFLDYILTLKSNHQPLLEGEYWSTIRFRMDYY